MAEDKTVRKLRRKLESALSKQKMSDAIDLLGKLMEADPKVPRWAHKRGDLLRKERKRKEAVECYAVAVELYAEQGFIARAVAMAKTILNLDPSRVDILESVDPQAAMLLHRQQRPQSAPVAPVHPAVLPESGLVAAHPAVIPDATPVAHPAVIPDAAPAAHPAVIPEPPAPHPAIVPEIAATHPAVVPDTPPRHPAIIDDVPAAPPAGQASHPMVLDDAPPPPPAAPRQAAGQPVVLDDPPPPPPAPAAPIAPPFDARPGSQPVTLDELPPPPRAPAAAIAPPFDPNAGARPVVLGEAPPPPAAPQPVLAAPPAAAPDLATSILETAAELVIAPDVRPHETRFSDLPPSSNIARDLSEIEFSNRAPALKPASLAPEPPSATTLSQLPLFPLFAEVPKDALAALTQQSEVIELEDGNVLMRKGDPADALYGIVEGSVQVQIPGQNLKLTLAEGDVFGESCLLPGERRHADVIVLGHVLALKVPRVTLNTLIGSFPRLAEVLLELLTRRLLGNLLQASPLFQEFDAHGRQELAKTFEVRRAGGGTKLAEMGKVMDGLYISLTGTLRVTDASGNNADFGPGTMFGQGSLLTHEPSSVHVTALANMVLLRMPSESFHTLAMQFPSILMTVSELEPVAKVSF